MRNTPTHLYLLIYFTKNRGYSQQTAAEKPVFKHVEAKQTIFYL